VGKYPFVMDEKRRVSTPAQYRALLEKEPTKSLSMFNGFAPCIWVYPERALDSFQANFDRAEFATDEEAEIFKLHFFSSATTCEPDSQGRIILSDEQIKCAGITRSVLIVGNCERFEIWAPERYEAQMAKIPRSEAAMRDLAKRFLKDPPSRKSSGEVQ
jgi:MraZ protein